MPYEDDEHDTDTVPPGTWCALCLERTHQQTRAVCKRNDLWLCTPCCHFYRRMSGDHRPCPLRPPTQRCLF